MLQLASLWLAGHTQHGDTVVPLAPATCLERYSVINLQPERVLPRTAADQA